MRNIIVKQEINIFFNSKSPFSTIQKNTFFCLSDSLCACLPRRLLNPQFQECYLHLLFHIADYSARNLQLIEPHISFQVKGRDLQQSQDDHSAIAPKILSANVETACNYAVLSGASVRALYTSTHHRLKFLGCRVRCAPICPIGDSLIIGTGHR